MLSLLCNSLTRFYLTGVWSKWLLVMKWQRKVSGDA